VALRQHDADKAAAPGATATPAPPDISSPTPGVPKTASSPNRFYGTVSLDSARTGRDAARIADEVIAHLSGLMGATVTVTLEIQAHVPNGVPDNVVRTVTENSRTLKFSSHGFEVE
jgi:hypothetical protein